MAWFRANYESGGGGIPLVPWDTGTDAEIIAMIEGYYNGDIPLKAIESVWSIGDKRSIHLDAMEATGVSESHHADDYEFVIIDFNHDLLVEPIKGITKALITIQQDRILYKNTTSSSFSSNYPSQSDEGGYMNSSNTNYTGWNTCARRTWCNSVYYNAFPQYIKGNIKQVYKSTAHSGYSSPTWVANTDKCFLLSEMEVFGLKSNSAETGSDATHYINGTSGTSITMPAGGSKYSIFVNASDRRKLPAYNSYISGYWWERSPYGYSSSAFCITGIGGLPHYGSANYTYGIAPALCL
jgi:hypothetical protein